MIHKWTRFVIPRDKHFSYDEEGFLLDETMENFYKYHETNLKLLANLRDEQCLILLGEPGIGKSSILRQEFNSCEEYKLFNEMNIYKELNIYGSEERLIREIFEHKDFNNWLESGKNLTLFLDSLDEGLLNITKISQVLASQIEKLPLDRMKIRLSCRTSAWPMYLETRLNDIFKKESQVFELLPLRKCDVEEACLNYEIDSDYFIKAITEKAVVPLSIKPNTLNFLLMRFKSHGDLPSSKLELYRQGCELHCKEHNDSRKTSRMEGQLSVNQRMNIASRIASMMIFSNKMSIYTGANIHSFQNTLRIEDIISNHELDIELGIKLSPKYILEVLDTGLFTSRGIELMGWSHHSYAEFLAGVFLINHKVSEKQLRTLFFDSHTGNSKVIPNLQQSAAWLASGDKSFFQLVLKLDSDVLLRSDLLTLDDEKKKQIIDSLFENIKNDKSLIVHDYDLKIKLKSLKFPGLANQLRPVLADINSHSKLKEFAIDVAEICKIEELAKDVVDLILNDQESLFHKRNAAHAIQWIGNKSENSRLKELLSVEDEKLRGSIFSILWPEHVTFPELVPYLKSPGKDYNYSSFLQSNLLHHLKPEDFSLALHWARTICLNRSSSSSRKVINQIIEHTWDLLGQDDVLKEMSLLILEIMKNHRSVFNDDSDKEFKKKFKEQKDFRRRIVNYYFEHLTIGEINNSYLIAFSNLINEEDINWIFELFEKQTEEEKRKQAASLARYFTDVNKEDHLKLALFYCSKYEEVREEFLYKLGPIELGSEYAKTQKDYYKSEKKRSRNKEKNYEKRILKYIEDSFEILPREPVKRLHILIEYICVESKTGKYTTDVQDITDGSFWKFLTDEQRKIIVESGKDFLNLYEVDVLNSIEYKATSPNSSTYTYNNFVVTGLKIFRLLYKTKPEYLYSLDVTCWKKWSPAFLLYPVWGNYEDDIFHSLLKNAYIKSPEEFLLSAHRKLTFEMEESSFSVFRKIKNFTDTKLTNELLEFVLKSNKSVLRMISALGELVDLGSIDAEEELKKIVSDSHDRNGNFNLSSLHAVNELLKNSPSAAWEFLEPFFSNNIDFFKAIMSNDRSHSFGESSLLTKLSDDSLIKICIFLYTAFPHEKDNFVSGFVGSEERANRLRSTALESLVNRGTKKACDGIAILMTAFPHLDFFKRSLLLAQNRARLIQWLPLEPKDLLIISRNSEKRIVRDIIDLRNCIIESFMKFEVMLHGETSAIADIWNTEKGRIAPKTEDEFSDRVKRFLEEDLQDRGVIANREVEIKRGQGGSYTDIHVNALALKGTNSLEKLTLIIEVKGCWHDEVYEAMETQLANKYLKDNVSKYGIYLVGGFLCNSWSNEVGNARKAKSKKHDVLSNSNRFEEQSKRLNSQGYDISPFILDCRFRKDA
jgi:hypothetical protein